MKRSKKWLLVVGMLVLLPLPIYFLWSTSMFWQKYLHVKLPALGNLNPVFAWYLIGISALVLVFLIIGLIVTVCWPVQRDFNLIRKRDGQVKVTSKAINGFVANSLADLPYLTKVKVDSRLTNRKIRIRISGDLGSGENVAALLDDYLKELEKQLKQLLGIDQKPKIKIKFVNYHKPAQSRRRVQ